MRICTCICVTPMCVNGHTCITPQEAAKDLDSALASGRTADVLVVRAHFWRHSDPESALAELRGAIALQVCISVCVYVCVCLYVYV
jgi:hypothetical protein